MPWPCCATADTGAAPSHPALCLRLLSAAPADDATPRTSCCAALAAFQLRMSLCCKVGPLQASGPSQGLCAGYRQSAGACAVSRQLPVLIGSQLLVL